MKKVFLIATVASVLFSINIKAQNDDSDSREKISFGVKAGANYSNVWDEQGQDFRADSKLGFAGGAFLGIPIGKILGVQPEILLSQKGFQASGTLLGSPYSLTRTTNHIDVPVQLQIKPVQFLTLLAGPQFSYLMSQKTTYTWGPNSTDQEQEFNNDNLRKNALGFVVGADININHFVLSGRMGWDFQNNNGDGSSYTPRYKNQWLQLTAGLKI